MTTQPFNQARQARLEQEANPGAILRQFLQGLQGMSSYGRDLYGNQGNALLESFLATAASPQATFADFLRTNMNQAPMNQAQMLARLKQFQGYQGQPAPADPMADWNWTQANENYGGKGGNQNVYNALAAPTLQGVNPLFHGAATKSMQGIFDKFQGEDPSGSFLDFITKRGGFFGGQ